MFTQPNSFIKLTNQGSKLQNLLSLAEYARRFDMSKPTVSEWKRTGLIVMQGDRVDVDASDAKLRMYRAGGLPAIVNPLPTARRGRPPAKRAGGIDLNCIEPIELRTDDIRHALLTLDGTQQFDWSEAGECERARQAALCVGYVAVESPLRDDGHWGWFQIRDGGSVVDGYGYELAPPAVVRVCREQVAGAEWEPDEMVTVIPALLHLLARPFMQGETPPTRRADA